jgi:hypothetical protein
MGAVPWRPGCGWGSVVATTLQVGALARFEGCVCALPRRHELRELAVARLYMKQCGSAAGLHAHHNVLLPFFQAESFIQLKLDLVY